MANIVLTTHWTSGDVYPFIRIGMVLKKRGHQVTLFTHRHYEGVVKQAGLSFTASDTSQAWETFINDNSLIVNPLDNPQNALEFERKHQHRDQLLQEYNGLKHLCSTETVLVARHRSSSAALAVAERLQIPLVSVFLAPSYLTQIALDEELFGTELVADLNVFREEIGLPPIHSWMAWMLSSNCNIGLWPEWFASPAPDWPVAAIPAGFPLSDEITQTDSLPREVQEMLQGGEPLVLITSGSTKLVRPDFYSASTEACRLLKCQGILVAPYPDLIPRHLPAEVKWFAYLPLARVMPYVSAIIHHGGIGTVSDALAAGIPQLILPEGFDRPDNAVRLVRLGVAESLPPIRWKPELIVEALEKIMLPAFHQRCQNLAQRLRDDDFATNVGELIEQAISNDRCLISIADRLNDSPLPFYSGSAAVSSRSDQQNAEGTDLFERLEKLSTYKRALLVQWLRQKGV